jgi:hypothetical protein
MMKLFGFRIGRIGKIASKQKIFCIGRNKTGTTSLKIAAKDLGFEVGNQKAAELLFKDYLKRDFRSLVRYCETAEFFQDIPFSLPYTYQILDYAFPDSKFILSVRDSAEQWYESFIRFQIKVNGVDGRLPTKEELLANDRVFKGFAYWTKNDVYQTEDDDPYNKDILIRHYNNYNSTVQHYFRQRTNLLVINVAETNSYYRFCEFLNREPVYDRFPWVNRTKPS